MYKGGAWTTRSLQSCSSLPRQTNCGSRSRLRRSYATWIGVFSSSCITSWNSAVGRLRRLSLCRRTAMVFLPLFLFNFFAGIGRLVSRCDWCSERLDQFVEVAVHIENAREFSKGPAPVGTKIVHAGNPEGAHRVSLILRVFAAETFDLDNKIQRFLLTVIDLNDEIGKIFSRRR